MLNLLLERLAEVDSVKDKFNGLNERATKEPQTKEDILDLVKLTKYRLNENEFPELSAEEVVEGIKGCKQVLVETSDYYYI